MTEKIQDVITRLAEKNKMSNTYWRDMYADLLSHCRVQEIHQCTQPEAASSKAEEAIVEHNMGCKSSCGKTSGYPHVIESRKCDPRRNCPDCPLDWMIDGFPSSRPQLPAEGDK